jgi:hypothetical protein
LGTAVEIDIATIVAKVAIVCGLAEVAIVIMIRLRSVAYCKDLRVVGIGFRKEWMNMRIIICSSVRIQLFFGGREPRFAEEGNEALPIFARNSQVTEGSNC